MQTVDIKTLKLKPATPKRETLAQGKKSTDYLRRRGASPRNTEFREKDPPFLSCDQRGH